MTKLRPPVVSIALAAVLLAALGGVAAGAVVDPPPQPQTTAEEEAEETEEEDPEEEIEVELEFEEGEEEANDTPPPECLLHGLDPRLVARFDRGDLRLSLRYASDLPTRASVSYWLKGARGAARLGTASRHLGRRGKLTLTRRLDDRTLAKLRAARVIVVQLRVPDTPSLCRPYLTMRLTERLVFDRVATWYEPL